MRIHVLLLLLSIQFCRGDLCMFNCPCEEGTGKPQNAFDIIASCMSCPPGKWQPGNYMYCQDCPVGYFSRNYKNHKCYECSEGHFAANPGQSSCTECPEGKYGTQRGQTSDSSCHGCPPGRYTDQRGHTSCKICPTGQFAIEGQSSCTECPRGYYGRQTAQSSCTECPAGRYAVEPGEISCSECHPGRYGTQSGLRSASCQYCPKGYFAYFGQSSCTICPAGQYGTQSGQGSCASCLAGQYGTQSGQTSASSCQGCALGQYTDQEGQSSCKSCPVGQYTDQEGQGTCKNCPAGQYGTQSGQTSASSCQGCPAGQYTDQIGQSSCASCSAGRFANVGQSSCQDCPAGQYGTQTGQSTCKNCPEGQYGTQTGQTSASSCKECPTGWEITKSSQTSCNICPSGWYESRNDVYQYNKCFKCDLGKYATDQGQSSCQDCPAGRFALLLVVMSSCKDCPAGQYGTQTGQWVCKNCPAGQYGTQTGQNHCTNCLAGQYTDQEGQSSCASCSAGRFAIVGQSSCQDCPAGWTSVNGSAECIFARLACTHTDGKTANVADCQCGTNNCTQSGNGRFCFAPGNHCATSAISTCTVETRSAPNKAPDFCICGTEGLCETNKKSYCMASENTCYKFPYDHGLLRLYDVRTSGVCEYEKFGIRSTQVETHQQCILASIEVGWEDKRRLQYLNTAVGNKDVPTYPPGCIYAPTEASWRWWKNNDIGRTVFNTDTTSTRECSPDFPCVCSIYASACANRDGSSANSAPCICGNTRCTEDTGTYCYEDTNKCRKAGQLKKIFKTFTHSDRHNPCNQPNWVQPETFQECKDGATALEINPVHAITKKYEWDRYVTGCFLLNDVSALVFNTNTENMQFADFAQRDTPECAPCICTFIAPDCTNTDGTTINTGDSCICGNTGCSANAKSYSQYIGGTLTWSTHDATGMYCMAALNQCGKAKIDCAGAWGGNATEDNCGTCDTNSTNDCTQDCLGIWGGTATKDKCGICDTDSANDCTQDCLGIWGGTATQDNCGICDTDSTNDCTQDCAGTWGGNATEDNCNICDTDSTNDCVQDCAGAWGGAATKDNCGTCDSDSTNDCTQDCLGVWGGTATKDCAGTCEGTSVKDCQNVCGGTATTDQCGQCSTLGNAAVCNATDQEANGRGPCRMDPVTKYYNKSCYKSAGVDTNFFWVWGQSIKTASEKYRLENNNKGELRLYRPSCKTSTMNTICKDLLKLNLTLPNNVTIQGCPNGQYSMPTDGGFHVFRDKLYIGTRNSGKDDSGKDDFCGDPEGTYGSSYNSDVRPCLAILIEENSDNSDDVDFRFDCAGSHCGKATKDKCGTCDTNSTNDCTQDCLGIWGGTATEDCAGKCEGTAIEDKCGICDTDSANDCTQDCLGIWGGNATKDNCGTCDTNSTNDCTQDCAGTWGGNATEDNCGTCDTNSTNDCTQDCLGIWGGTATKDCAGTCEGTAIEDICGACRKPDDPIDPTKCSLACTNHNSRACQLLDCYYGNLSACSHACENGVSKACDLGCENGNITLCKPESLPVQCVNTNHFACEILDQGCSDNNASCYLACNYINHTGDTPESSCAMIGKKCRDGNQRACSIKHTMCGDKQDCKWGCTRENSCNYISEAIYDDGSCVFVRCQNGGSCTSNSSDCDCPLGWTGPTCETATCAFTSSECLSLKSSFQALDCCGDGNSGCNHFKRLYNCGNCCST